MYSKYSQLNMEEVSIIGMPIWTGINLDKGERKLRLSAIKIIAILMYIQVVQAN